MTNKEALQSVLGTSVSDNMLEKALIDIDADPEAEYDKSMMESIDKCAVPILYSLLSTENISEGGYSKSFDRTAIQARLKTLAYKYNLTEYLDAVPTISTKRLW